MAIKRPHDHVAVDPVAATRFRNEGLAAASLSHPGVVTVYDAGQDDRGPFLVMEYVEGEALSELLRRDGPFSPARAMAVAEQVARALQHAHDRGLVHRDVKPSNILLTPDGAAKLTDFGIARSLDATDRLTGTGTVIGTADYLSPEQAAGEEGGPPADIYALGVVLYEMLTGRPPFERETAVATALAHQTEPPSPPGELAEVPEDLERVILRALAKDPSDRFPTAEALADELSRWRVLEETLGPPAPPPAPSAPGDRPTAPTRPLGQPASSTRVLTRSRPVAEPRRPSPPRTGLLLFLLAGILALAGLLLWGASSETDQPPAPTTAPAPAAETTTSTSTTTPEPSVARALTDLEGIIADGVSRGDVDRKTGEELTKLARKARDEWDDGDVEDAASELDDLDEKAMEAFEKERISWQATLEEILEQTDLIRELMEVDPEETDDDDGGPPGPPSGPPGRGRS